MKYVLILVSSLIIASIIFFNSEKLIGISPRIRLAEYQQKFKNWENISKENNVANINKAISEIEDTLKTKPEQNLIFLLIASLKKSITLNPNNSVAILKLADLSFDKQIFDVAESYYRDYLKLNPSDLTVKAKLASSLTFQNKLKDGEDLLRQIIIESPKDFRNLTFLAINLVQQKKNKEAIELVEKAIILAEDDKTKERLNAFLVKLKTPEWIVNLANNLSSNPMVGNKLQDIQVEGSILKIILSDFPMTAMPEVARNKFLEKIRAQTDKSIRTLQFLDASDSKVMYTEEL